MTSARPGMVLAMPVFHPKRGATVLLKKGFALDEQTCLRLRELSIRDVWIEYPGLEMLAEFVNPEAMAEHAELTAQLADAFDTVLKDQHAELDYWSYRRAVSSLLEKILERPRAGLFVHEMCEHDRPALRHASTVCLLSLLMGIKLGDYLIAERSRLAGAQARDVSALGVGAMLHDVGMLRLPAEIAARWRMERDDGDQDWRRHVLIGYDMVRGSVEPTAAAAVLHHHQRWDGSGFPHRQCPDGRVEPVAGSDIHVFARIAACADLFDRLRAPSDVGDEAHGVVAPRPAVRALHDLLTGPARAWLDPIVLRALLSVAPPYPPGCLVRLSDGRHGVVTEWSADDPCRPVVRELRPTPDGSVDPGAEPGEPVDLRVQRGLEVAWAEGEDVRRDNFYPADPGEFSLSSACRGLFNRADELRRQSA